MPAAGDECVVGVAELVFQARRTILGPVHDRLRVFDPQPHLERLLLDRHTAAEKHSVRVAGAVTDREDCHVAGEVAAACHKPDEPAVAQVEVLHLATETDFAAQ